MDLEIKYHHFTAGNKSISSFPDYRFTIKEAENYLIKNYPECKFEFLGTYKKNYVLEADSCGYGRKIMIYIEKDLYSSKNEFSLDGELSRVRNYYNKELFERIGYHSEDVNFNSGIAIRKSDLKAILDNMEENDRLILASPDHISAKVYDNLIEVKNKK